MPYSFTALPAGFQATAISDGRVAGLETLPPQSFPPSVIYGLSATNSLVGSPITGSGDISGLNDASDYVGSLSGPHGVPFAVLGGVFQTNFGPPAQPLSNTARALNNQQQIVGGGPVFDAHGASTEEGYVASPGTSGTLLAVPGAGATQATGINDSGLVVGDAYSGFFIGQGSSQGFLFNESSFATVDAPGAVSTSLVAINNADEIAGTYTDGSGTVHGFTDVGGAFIDIVGPGGNFLPVGLNNAGQIVGTFGGTGLSYIATPATTAVPEPATFVLLATGLLALGTLRLPRHRVVAPGRPQ